MESHSELAREKMWARIYITPALQAEEDRDQVRRYLADQAREKELMGSETKVYNSDRCVLFSQYPSFFSFSYSLFWPMFQICVKETEKERKERKERGIKANLWIEYV